MNNPSLKVPVMADLAAREKSPEYLFWVGCAGAYDDRYKKVTRAFTKILLHLQTDFAILGKEERCTGDPARRAGNEMLFQMMALTNIELLNAYRVKKIITICPHCFNIFKNEYPELGGNYEVIHHTQFLRQMLDQGKIKMDKNTTVDALITYHDPCYLGRGNQEYDSAREVLKKMGTPVTEMKRSREKALCCGAGGGQMFKEAEEGDKEVFMERTEEALQTRANIIASSCPFCMAMLTDGIKYKDKEESVKNQDIAELLANYLEL